MVPTCTYAPRSIKFTDTLGIFMTGFTFLQDLADAALSNTLEHFFAFRREPDISLLELNEILHHSLVHVTDLISLIDDMVKVNQIMLTVLDVLPNLDMASKR